MEDLQWEYKAQKLTQMKIQTDGKPKNKLKR
jgi:hypothetical protein